MTDAPTTPDPIEIAMEAEAAGAPPSGVAAQFLANQNRLTLWQIASERAGFALKLLTAAAGLAVAALLGAMAWQASRADGLVIKPFSVPPDLAARGLTGEAVASQVMDRLDAIDRDSRVGLGTKVSADWGAGVSIAIPQTGISVDQLDQWLRDRLGHQVKLTGELVRGRDGQLTLTAREGVRGLPPATGSDAEVGRMLQATAEAIYAQGNALAYSAYLRRQQRWPELLAFQKVRLATADTARDRASALTSIGISLRQLEGADAAARTLRSARLLDSQFSATAADALGGIEYQQGHWEAAYFYAIRSGVEAVHDPRLTQAQKASIALGNAGLLADRRHDYLTELVKRRDWVESGAVGFDRQSRVGVATALADLHEISAARREWEADLAVEGAKSALTRMNVARHFGEWPATIAAADENAAALAELPDKGVRNLQWRWVKAEALARLGRLEEARAAIAPTPADCAPCLMSRGLIAALAGQPAEADRWYAEAVRLTPSLADASFAWAQALYARGDRARAIAQFARANRLAPRWADPLELWGEALLAGGDAKGAEAKFAAAATFAPRWRNLRLKWADALARLGKAEAAAAQRRLAAGMAP